MKRKNIFITVLCLLITVFLVSCKKDKIEDPQLNIFEDIIFEDEEVIYDGEYHSIYALNVPEFASVRYEGNEQREIGVYIVTAIIEADNYETFVISASLYIVAPLNKFEKIIFEDEEVIYDGEYHSIYALNVPEFASVRYEGNEQREVGVYTVTATIEADNYETFVISAKMKIVAVEYEFNNLVFEDKEVVYDGEYHSIVVQGDLPEGTIITYKAVNNSGKKNEFKEVGEYYIEAKVECEFYVTLYMYAYLRIVEASIIDIDDSKEEFLIDENLKYYDFFNELKKHNFVCFLENGSRQEYPSGELVYSASSYHTIAVSENKFYVYNDYIEEGEYIYDTMEFAEIVNDQVLITEVKVSDDSVSYYKIPIEGFYETFGAYYIQIPFAHLSEGIDGGFETNEVPAYYTWYSDYEISDGKFKLTINNYIFHPEFTNSEVSSLEYYNIGNVKINIPEKYRGNYNDLDSYKIRNFTLDGIEYLYFNNVWDANIDLSFYDVVLVEQKEITILASIYDKKVETISYPYYVYNKDYVGYEFNVYFNEDFEYQGDYVGLGSLAYSDTNRAISKFEAYGGVVNYYGTW